MRAWWSMLLEPNMETILRNICDCSFECLEEPIQKMASGPLSLRICSSLSPISLIACSHVMRRYLPSTSFIGYFRRCEFSVMPCSRIDAPLAQCAPMLIGESNTGSCRTHTPSWTTASMEQPTEQCVQTVRLISVLPALGAAAFASPTMPSGSWLANAAAPAVMPVPFRNERRSIVFAASAEAARASGLTAWAWASDLRVSSMTGSSDFGGLVVLQDVLGEVVAVGLGAGRSVRPLRLRLARAGDDGRHGACAAEAGGHQEFPAVGGLGRFHHVPPFREDLLQSSWNDSVSRATNAAASAATRR